MPAEWARCTNLKNKPNKNNGGIAKIPLFYFRNSGVEEKLFRSPFLELFKDTEDDFKVNPAEP